jgi:hypothetical protein
MKKEPPRPSFNSFGMEEESLRGMNGGSDQIG